MSLIKSYFLFVFPVTAMIITYNKYVLAAIFNSLHYNQS